MVDCEKLEGCTFFKTYQTDESRKLALAGLAAMYCQGEKQNICKRKKVCVALGGDPKNVPTNMMPTGQPLAGTDSRGWSLEVMDALKS